MKTLTLSVLTAAALVTSTFLAVSAHAGQGNNDHQVQCADGTIFVLNGDEITDDVACAYHGGVSPVAVFVGGTDIKNNTPIPAIPLKAKPKRMAR